jgi:rubrerythrin
MSRIPRDLENLKAGFNAEAAAAARFRAYSARARRDALPHLADHWLELARQKDQLAILQLDAAGQVRGAETDLEAAIAEERYENEVLYPKLLTASGDEAAAIFGQVLAAQEQHLARLDALRGAIVASQGDVPATLRAEPEQTRQR